MGKSNERNPHITVIPLGTTTSGVALTVPGIYFRKHSRIKNAYLVDQAGITKSNSNYQIVTLQDNSSSPVAYASVATSDSAAVANTQLALQLSVQADDSAQAVSQESDVPAGTMLNVANAPVGTAILTKAVLVVEHYPL